MKNEAQEAESSFNTRLRHQRPSFTIRTCRLPSAPQPCTGLAEQAGTETGFAFLISGFLLSTILLSHYPGWNVITIITTVQVFAQKLYRILSPEASVKLTYLCVYFGAALEDHPGLWYIIVFPSDSNEGNRREKSVHSHKIIQWCLMASKHRMCSSGLLIFPLQKGSEI